MEREQVWEKEQEEGFGGREKAEAKVEERGSEAEAVEVPEPALTWIRRNLSEEGASRSRPRRARRAPTSAFPSSSSRAYPLVIANGPGSWFMRWVSSPGLAKLPTCCHPSRSPQRNPIQSTQRWNISSPIPAGGRDLYCP